MADSASKPDKPVIFPRWANYLLPAFVVVVLGAAVYIPLFVNYGMGAPTLNVGYEPHQPVAFSHALHAGKLGMDCRYCHSTVEQAAFAAIPATEVCINCHNPEEAVNGIRKGSTKLQPVYDSYLGAQAPDWQPGDDPADRWVEGKEPGSPIEWVTVHQVADYAYFNHAAHVNKGVSCVDCHGRIDRMEVVRTVAPLSMSWCLDCHREPEKHLRPVDQVFNLAWSPLDDPSVKAAIAEGDLPAGDRAAAQLWLGSQLKETYNIHDQAYMVACSTCHR